MQVNKTIELPDGTAKFEGTLTQEELDYVIKTGLTVLLQAGVFAIKETDNEVMQ